MQLQYLNGTAAAEPQSLFESVQSQLLHTGADIDSVVGGFDLDDYQGLNDAADTEKLRAYLLRTKKIADESPALIQSVRNPETFSGMCAYLLQYWDTAEREQAALLMAQKEKRLFDSGMIRRVEGDEFGSEFFKALYLMLRPQSEIAGLCGATILRRLKGKVRASVASARRGGRDASAAVQSVIRRHKAATPGLSGSDDPMDELTLAGVVYGLEDEYHGGEENDRRYLTRLRAAIGEAPALFFPTRAEAQAVERSLGSVLDYWDNAVLRDIALSQAQNNPALTQQTSGLFGRLRKRLKKIAKGVKKAVKTVGKGVKTAAKTVAKGVKTAAKAVAKITKKIGKRIARIAKKVVKFLIRFNPVTAIMRAILCLCARCNWFSLASKCYPGSLTEAEALKLGVSKEDYDKKHKPSYAKFKSVFEKIGGRESKLKSRLRTGYGRKAKGGLDTSISKSSLTKLYEEGDKDAKEEVADEKAQLKQEGAVEDSTVPAGQIVKTKVTVEVAANAITTTAAASLYETAGAAKVLANIPKGTPLLYDTATNNATFYNVNYGGNNGYVKKSLVRAATDAEAQKLQTTDTTRTVTVDAPVSGLAGLGYVEPVTLSAIAASVSTVTGLVATVAKAFGKDKVAAAAETVDSATKLAQGISANVSQAKASGEGAVAALKQQGASAGSKAAAIISAGKQIADTGKQAVSAGTQAVSSLKQQGASAGSKAAAIISAGKQIADAGKQAVSPAQAVSTPFTQAAQAAAPTAAQPEPGAQSSDTLTQTVAAGGQPQNTSPTTSLSVALSPAAKKYLIIGGVVLAGGLAVYALSRKK